MSPKWLRKSRVTGFWTAVAISIVAPIMAAAWLIPSERLDALVDDARWGGPLWFGVVAGLAGVLRHRLHETLTAALEGDHWRVLEKRHQGVEKLQRRLDKMVALSLVLGLSSFFVSYAHSMASGLVANLIAAVPFGAAGYVIWCFYLWSEWRARVDRISREVAVAKRKKNQANEQLERLRQDEYRSDLQPPVVKTARRVTTRPGKH